MPRVLATRTCVRVPGLPELAQGHFLGNELSRAGLKLFAKLLPEKTGLTLQGARVGIHQKGGFEIRAATKSAAILKFTTAALSRGL
jgi:hypothetical protein